MRTMKPDGKFVTCLAKTAAFFRIGEFSVALTPATVFVSKKARAFWTTGILRLSIGITTFHGLPIGVSHFFATNFEYSATPDLQISWFVGSVTKQFV